MSMGVDGYLKYLDDSYKAGDITIMQKKRGGLLLVNGTGFLANSDK